MGAAPQVVVVNQQSDQDPAADSMAMTLCCLGWWLFPPLLFCAACSCNHKSSGARCWGRAALAGIIAWVVLIILIVVMLGSAVAPVSNLTSSSTADSRCQATNCAACRAISNCGWCSGDHQHRWGGDKCAPGTSSLGATSKTIGCGWGGSWKYNSC